MKATEANLLSFLKKSPQFIIPIYQRTYSWTESECKQLWDDILRAGRDQSISVHFIGSIVYIEDGLSQVSHQSPLLVIDGQQRLTTVTLLLSALANALADTEPVEGFSTRKLRNYYLLNPEETGERHFKLLLSQTDRQTLCSIVSRDELPSERSQRVEMNSNIFANLVSSLGGDLTVLCRGVAKLVIVDVALSRDQDNPQLIFESMNSTGRELSQADLIRNYILMGLEHGLQTRLYEKFWRPMEISFGQEAYSTHFDGFMRHYLTVKTGEIPRLDDVYKAFKAYAQQPNIAVQGVETLVTDLRNFAAFYCALALGAESDPVLKTAFHDLRELKVDVAYPFLLEVYEDYGRKLIGRDDFLEVVRLIEAYVFRRAICVMPPNSLNKTFATFSRAIRRDRYIESIKAHFLLMRSYRRFPTDDEFRRDLQIRDLYNFRSRSYWLRRFENFGRKERVPVAEYTIEHIMPQNPALSSAWQVALGTDWKRVHETYLHTLGNLTLTGYNSEYSDRPFTDKRDREGGFAHSPLKVNKGLGGIEVWNEDEIKNRAGILADQAVSVWPSPYVPNDILEVYEKIDKRATVYSIDDHPNLKNGIAGELFSALRKEVLKLDPCVTEEFWKLYVAYKAETNFLDVIPQTKQLILSLNIAHSDIVDPHDITRNVADLGRWGNGDVEVKLSRIEDLQYIIGLVRQSLERQLDVENAF